MIRGEHGDDLVSRVGRAGGPRRRGERLKEIWGKNETMSQHTYGEKGLLKSSKRGRQKPNCSLT